MIVLHAYADQPWANSVIETAARNASPDVALHYINLYKNLPCAPEVLTTIAQADPGKALERIAWSYAYPWSENTIETAARCAPPKAVWDYSKVFKDKPYAKDVIVATALGNDPERFQYLSRFTEQPWAEGMLQTILQDNPNAVLKMAAHFNDHLPYGESVIKDALNRAAEISPHSVLEFGRVVNDDPWQASNLFGGEFGSSTKRIIHSEVEQAVKQAVLNLSGKNDPESREILLKHADQFAGEDYGKDAIISAAKESPVAALANSEKFSERYWAGQVLSDAVKSALQNPQDILGVAEHIQGKEFSVRGLLGSRQITGAEMIEQAAARVNNVKTRPENRSGNATGTSAAAAGAEQEAPSMPIAEHPAANEPHGPSMSGKIMGVGITIQALGTLTGPEADRLTTGQKIETITGAGLGVGQTGLEYLGPSMINTTGGPTNWTGIGNNITGDVTALGRVSGGMGGAGGLLGMGTSGYGMYDAIKTGNTTEGVLSTGNFISSTAYTVGGVAQVMGEVAFASDATGVGVVVGAPIQVIATGLQAADYHAQSVDLQNILDSRKQVEAFQTQGGALRNYQYVDGLPLKPHIDEYRGLSALAAEMKFQNITYTDGKRVVLNEIAKYPKELARVADTFSDAYDKGVAIRQDATDEMSSVAHTSTPGKISDFLRKKLRGIDDNAIAESNLRTSEQYISLGVAARAASQELQAGSPDGNGTKMAGYSYRMDEYNKRLAPLEHDYAEQIAQLEKLPSIYKAIGGPKTNAEIMATADPSQRKYYENLLAKLPDAQQALKQPEADLNTAQAEIKDLQDKLTLAVKKHPPGSQEVTRYVSMVNKKIDETKPLKEKVDGLRTTLATAQNDVTGYIGNELAKKNVLEERAKVEAMTPEAQSTYFQKNQEFVAKAGLTGRGDLAYTGLSTSHDEYMAKAEQFAPTVLEAQARKEAEQYRAASKELGPVNDDLRAQVGRMRAALGDSRCKD